MAIRYDITTELDITTPVTPLLTYECNRTTSCGCGYSDVVFRPTRIVNGEDVVESSWSMIVSLRFYGSEEHSCAGTLLSSSFVLTAAHCVDQFSSTNSTNITIIAGITSRSDSTGYQRNIDEIYVHPNYTGWPYFLSNIALLHIDRPLYFQNNPILAKTCVYGSDSSLSTNEQYPKNGTSLVVIGWGAMRPGSFVLAEYLQQIQINAIDHEDQICKDTINNSELQFCAGLYDGEKDGCLGDSGGPILYWTGQYWEQVGIIGYNFHCEQPGYPGIYTRLSYYWQWMETILLTKNEHLEPQTSFQFSTPITSSRPPMTTATTTQQTTSVPPKTVTYECNRSPDECGCSLTNVVLSHDNQRLSSTNGTSEDAYPYSWSMVVSIRINSTKHTCTGTILSDSFILTAAHCVSNQLNNTRIIVAAGIHSLSQYITSIRRVDQVYIHENYINKIPYLHDIAILHLEQPLELKTQPILTKICLSNIKSSDSTGVSCLLSVGWEYSNAAENGDNIVQQIPVKSITNPNSTCFDSIYNDTYQFCAGLISKDSNTCDENFGEPVFVYRNKYWEQVGILSNAYGCIPTGHSGIYTRLSAYINWMQRIMTNTTIPMRRPFRTNNASKFRQNIFIFNMLFFTVKIFY